MIPSTTNGALKATDSVSGLVTNAASKTRIVEELREPALLLPHLVNEALAANERAKYLMTLLQTAKEHADHPEAACTDLKKERLHCGITGSTFDSVVQRSRRARRPRLESTLRGARSVAWGFCEGGVS
jgi:hypothetical protein